MTKTIAIVGRPNVGKSALFNTLVNRAEAIVSPNPGMTRDRTYSFFSPEPGNRYLLIDTGGLMFNSKKKITEKVNMQVDIAIGESDMLLFVVDAHEGLLPMDIEIAEKLRKTNKPVLLVVNKADYPAMDQSVNEFHYLGFDRTLAVSALHKRNMSGVTEIVTELLPSPIPSADRDEDCILRLCIIGRPNVGKSTLLNRIIGEDRVIVDSEPGTTRNPAKCFFKLKDREWEIVDVAGIWRRKRGKEEEEILSMIAARKEIDRANACVLMLDLTEELSFQDRRLSGWIVESATPLIIAGNKMDIVEDKSFKKDDYFKSLLYQMPFLSHASFVIISAKTGNGIDSIFSELEKIMKNSFTRISQEELDMFLQKIISKRPPPKSANVRPEVIGLYQESVNPPVFRLRLNHHRLDKIPQHWKNYVRNSIIDEFGFYGVPVSLEYRKHKPNKNIKIKKGKII